MASGGAGGFRSRFLDLDETLSAPLRLAAMAPGPKRRAGEVIGLVIAHSGDSYVWLALCAAAWLLGDDTWKLRGLLGAAGLVAAQALVSLTKYIVRRPRPAGTAGKIYRKADPYSFPSGHGARASLLIILACSFGPPWLGVAVCLWSPVMLWSRVAIGIHYVLDICGGLLLGTGVGLLLLWLTPQAVGWVQGLRALLGT
jgi:membrane-associated phospholipid phosphatase